MQLNWICKGHRDVSTSELYACLRLRSEVFIIEQNCIYRDVDGKDLAGETRHLMAWRGSDLVAYLRILDPGQNEGRALVGRVVTSASVRGAGLGHELIQRGLAECRRHWPGTDIFLRAQAHLQKYYERHGFVVVGEPFDDDGILHVGMLLAQFAAR
jgi:ElaA protein